MTYETLKIKIKQTMNQQLSPLVDKLKSIQNILVAVSKSPSVDQLSAAIGLAAGLNNIGKHATVVYSGETPSTIEFLKPEETIEKNTDSLRDFIIALDKSKADKLRYKVEDEVVRIYVTPFKTSLSSEDLEFGQGDFNIEAVIALGVREQSDLDESIRAHGRIFHSATVMSIDLHETTDLGTLNWFDSSASSLSEMAADLLGKLDKKSLDSQVATALLTGIVSETERFSNEKTSPRTMSTSAALMALGANQQLISAELTRISEEVEEVPENTEEDQDAVQDSDETTLELSHDEDSGESSAEEPEPEQQEEPVADEHPEEAQEPEQVDEAKGDVVEQLSSEEETVSSDNDTKASESDGPVEITVDEDGHLRLADESLADVQPKKKASELKLPKPSLDNKEGLPDGIESSKPKQEDTAKPEQSDFLAQPDTSVAEQPSPFNPPIPPLPPAIPKRTIVEAPAPPSSDTLADLESRVQSTNTNGPVMPKAVAPPSQAHQPAGRYMTPASVDDARDAVEAALQGGEPTLPDGTEEHGDALNHHAPTLVPPPPPKPLFMPDDVPGEPKMTPPPQPSTPPPPLGFVPPQPAAPPPPPPVGSVPSLPPMPNPAPSIVPAVPSGNFAPPPMPQPPMPSAMPQPPMPPIPPQPPQQPSMMPPQLGQPMPPSPMMPPPPPPSAPPAMAPPIPPPVLPQ
ncbi:MAG: hypothetical protein QG629_471 [Patescibacteria group bacterium]|nr:hypothetical protein [Candidatus Saccharibacteria bacterium]MDQ5963389.1 hypothetical protein [Patescibacteria group bacterium]